MRLGGYLLAAILFAAVVALGIIVDAGWSSALDRAGFDALALRAGTSPNWQIEAARWATWLGDGGRRIPFVVALAVWLLWDRRLKAALVVAVVMPLASVASSVLKAAFARPRPDLVPHLDHVSDLSFPSGHAAAGAVLVVAALLVPGGQPKLRLSAALGIMFAIGLSRPALGVHWPTDVIGGWLLGLAFALMAVALVRRLEGGR
jgi:undecaprenyl-diphosphatase